MHIEWFTTPKNRLRSYLAECIDDLDSENVYDTVANTM